HLYRKMATPEETSLLTPSEIINTTTLSESEEIREDMNKFFASALLVKQIMHHILDDYDYPPAGRVLITMTNGFDYHPVWDADWDVNFNSMYILVNKGIPLFTALYY